VLAGVDGRLGRQLKNRWRCVAKVEMPRCDWGAESAKRAPHRHLELGERGHFDVMLEGLEDWQQVILD